jgi:antirestriction protein ArdC
MNVYEVVTARVLKQLEAGVLPWRKTWTTGCPRAWPPAGNTGE